MARTYLLAAALLATALAACSKPEPPLKAQTPPSITGHVRVLDADVLIVDGRHIKLANAYAPEPLLHARCWAESLASDRAVDQVKELVQHAESYELRTTGQTDTYNRQLGYVSIDGADLGDTLYNQGLAARPSEPRFDWCAPISQKAPGSPKISSLYNFAN